MVGRLQATGIHEVPALYALQTPLWGRALQSDAFFRFGLAGLQSRGQLLCFCIYLQWGIFTMGKG